MNIIKINFSLFGIIFENSLLIKNFELQLMNIFSCRTENTNPFFASYSLLLRVGNRLCFLNVDASYKKKCMCLGQGL